MDEIEIVYREGYCECMVGDYCTQCHTQCAEDLGCKQSLSHKRNRADRRER